MNFTQSNCDITSQELLDKLLNTFQLQKNASVYQHVSVQFETTDKNISYFSNIKFMIILTQVKNVQLIKRNY